MFKIPMILGTVRRERESEKVARFVLSQMKNYPNLETKPLDLLDYPFPIMEERLRYRDDPPPGLREFAKEIDQGDGIVIVTPEYNHGYPGALKNAIDYLLPEFDKKPIGIVTVSAGGFGGVNCLAQLRLVFFGMGACPIPESLTVSRVQDTFDEKGTPKTPSLEKRTREFLDEMLWYTEAFVNQKKLQAER